jgi:hypothetical protein
MEVIYLRNKPEETNSLYPDPENFPCDGLKRSLSS